MPMMIAIIQRHRIGVEMIIIVASVDAKESLLEFIIKVVVLYL